MRDKQNDSKKSSKDEKPLRQFVKGTVDATNHTLACMEHSYNDAQEFVSSRIRPLYRQMSYAGSRILDLYEQRQLYGPQIIGSSSVLLGGLTAVRRGRIPGAFMGVMAGAGAYAAVYGVKVYPSKKN